MSWLKELAPLLGTVLGGPAGALVSAFGGVAASFVAEKLGLEDSTVETVNKALTAGRMSPDQIVKLKEAEIEFQKFLETNKIDLEKIAAADRDSARKMQMTTGSVVPAWLTFFLTSGFFGVLGAMFAYPEVKESQPLMIMLGSLGTAWTGACAFWFGTTHGSGMKTHLLSRAEAIK